MKKTIFLLGFIGFSAICFSQTANSNLISTTPVKASGVTFNNGSMKAVKIGEKIQITVNGEVKYKKDYTPKYPVNVKISGIKNDVKNKI
mgnify:CR=1 FL=1